MGTAQGQCPRHFIRRFGYDKVWMLNISFDLYLLTAQNWEKRFRDTFQDEFPALMLPYLFSPEPKGICLCKWHETHFLSFEQLKKKSKQIFNIKHQLHHNWISWWDAQGQVPTLPYFDINLTRFFFYNNILYMKTKY